MNQFEIREDDLTGEAIIELLQEHLEHMYEITPPESVHALDLERLKAPDIAFWTAWEGDELLGCGAMKVLDSHAGEIKSMRTVKAHRRKGVAAKILEHLMQEAKKRNYTHLYLETGSSVAFAAARSLYERYGFEYREPFAEYLEDSHSIFMMKKL